MDFVIIYLVIINIITFWVYGLDKWKAKRDSRRISEKTLIFLALAGGSIGAFAGMRVFHHKTQKMKFYLGVPLIFVLQAAIIYFVFMR